MKKLYKQFNRIEFGEEVEPMEVSEMEKERIKRKVMKKRRRYIPRSLSVAVLAIASVLVMGVSIGVSNPALAESLPIIGNIFELFKDNEQEYVFEDFGDYTTNFGITQESNGVRITITDAVYDRENITIAYTIESEQDLGDNPMIIGEDFYVGERIDFATSSQTTEKLEDNKFAGIFMKSLLEGEHPESIDFVWNANQIRSYDKLDRSLEVIEPIDGEWNFEITLDAIERDILKFDNLVKETEGFEVKLNKIATTPISASFYLRERVDKKLKGWEEEEWESIIFRYEVSDNLGNEYVLDWNGAWSNNDIVMRSRFVTTKLDEEATSLTITPIVSIYKFKHDDVDSTTGRELELVKDPFKIAPIIVPLDKK